LQPITSEVQPSDPSAVPAIPPFKQQLISTLSIPTYLVGTGDVSLQLAYQKHEAYLHAEKKYNNMVENKTWTMKRLNKIDLTELFISKSYYHSHYKIYFSKVSSYPDMKAWLIGAEDCPCDVDVWGIQKDSYNFSDLIAWLANEGTLQVDEDEDSGYKEKKKRSKGKEKEKGKEMVIKKKKEKKAEKEAMKSKKKKKNGGKEK